MSSAAHCDRHGESSDLHYGYGQCDPLQIVEKNLILQTPLSVSKINTTTGEEFPDAALRSVDSQSKVVEEWMSGDEPHRIDMLAPGWYTLVETIAPEGHLVANDVRFEGLATGEVQTVVMADEIAPEPEPKPEGGPEAPRKDLAQTGDAVPVWIFALLGVAACAVATVALATQRGGVQRIREKVSALMDGKR